MNCEFARHLVLRCAVAALFVVACEPSPLHSLSTSHPVSNGPAQSFKVGLYTNSDFSAFLSEQSQLQSAGAQTPLQLYLNYADFANFEGSPSPGQGIVDVSSLNQSNIQLVVAFEPTNASWCTQSSITTGNTHGCRLSDLSESSPNLVSIGNAYAQIAALADALNQPLILRFGSEMNANWDDWDYGYDPSDNSAQAFIAAFECIHHYVTKNLHGGQVLFAFAPNNVSYDGSDFYSDIQAFWPGSANVDVIGMDGYSVSNSFASDFGGQLSALERLRQRAALDARGVRGFDERVRQPRGLARRHDGHAAEPPAARLHELVRFRQVASLPARGHRRHGPVAVCRVRPQSARRQRRERCDRGCSGDWQRVEQRGRRRGDRLCP